MRFDTVIKNGTVYTAVDTYQADIGIRGEKIAAISANLEPDGAKVINAKGKMVIPGGIDVHVHLQLPFCGTVSSDDFYTGTKAAACGGVTTVIDFAGQIKDKGLMAGIKARMAEAEPKVCVDYSLHGMVTGYTDAIGKEYEKCVEFGVPTFKMFMIYRAEGWQSDDAQLFSSLIAAKQANAMILVHAESEAVMNLLIAKYLQEKDKWGAYAHVLSRPNFIEEEAIQRMMKWTEVTQGRAYIVHMSTGEGADLIKLGKEKGININAETCPQYLVLHDEVFKDKKSGHLYATCPQIKKKKDCDRMWKALVDGEVKIVSTDTCTFTTKQKAMWKGDFTKIPFGLPGVETLMPSVYTYGVREGKFSMNHFISLLSTNPAKMMGMFPKKGTIAVGSDADIAIIDPKRKKIIDYHKLATNCDWSPFQGDTMYGFPDITFSRGKIVVNDGKFVGERGHGKFVKRQLDKI